MPTSDKLGPPKVSIGLPVYNGEPHLRNAIESLLSQDYANFELIISDNASTDGTFDLCRTFAERDSRVRLYRNDTNIGAAANFNRVFELADGPYFSWAAHDDLVHSTYVSRCVGVLEENPDILLCSADITFIDESGAVIDYPAQYCRLHTRGMDLRRRAKCLTSAVGWFSLYGIFRATALRKTRLITPDYGCDVLLLLELLFQGQTNVLPERLFSFRYIPKETRRYVTDITGSAEHVPANPYTRLAQGLLRLIEDSGESVDLKVAMRNDLLDNVTRPSRRWRELILEENPAIARYPRHVQPVEMRRVLYKQLSASELAHLRLRSHAMHILRLPAELCSSSWRAMRVTYDHFMAEAGRVHFWADYGMDVGYMRRAVWYLHNLLRILGRQSFRSGHLAERGRSSVNSGGRNDDP